MRFNTPEEVQTTSISSASKKRRFNIKVLEEKKSKLINPKSIKSCDLLQLPVIGDKIKDKIQNTIRFYFENINSICSRLLGIDKGEN